MPPELQFGILGPLEVVAQERAAALGGGTPRRLLAMLLLHADEVVSSERLVDALWDGQPPASAAVTLRSHVAGLRRSLRALDGDHLLVTRRPGYCLQIAQEQLDAGRFEVLVADGRAAVAGGEFARGRHTLQSALALWRGEVLQDVGPPAFAAAAAARLGELRLAAVEARADADLGLGRHLEVAAELETLVQLHAFREPLWARLMVALYRSGRQAEALEAFRTVRGRLEEELGLSPGPELLRLETAILRQDPALAAPDGGESRAVGQPGPGPVGRAVAPPDAFLDVVRRSPMVGRARSLGFLHGLWQAVRDGGRRLALVSGEAGVGKTRLVAEVAADAASEGATVLVGHCEPTALIPYHAFAEIFRTSPEVAAAIEAAGLHDSEERRAVLHAAVAQLFARLTRSAPVVLVIEDSETIDPASAQLLRHLARHLPERMLLLVCFRDPPGSADAAVRDLLADLEGRSLADRLALAPLAEADLAALVAAWADAAVPDGFIRALWTSTGGNPFYTTEVLRDLTIRGAVDRAEDALRVPRGVQDVLRQRLHTLSAATREVVAAAPVLGPAFDTDLLGTVVGGAPQRAVDALAEAGRAGWFVETGRAWGQSYAFRHGLMREAVYADLPLTHRQRLHLRAADALETTDRQRPTDVAAGALHLRAAGSLAEPVRVAETSLHAAELAARVYAWDEAVAHAEAAVEVLAAAGAAPARRGEAAVRVAELLMQSHADYRRAIMHLETALELYRHAGDRSTVGTVHTRLGQVMTSHHSVMDIPKALAHFQAAEAPLVGGVTGVDACAGWSLAALFGLRTDEGRTVGERGLDLALELERPELAARIAPTLACHRAHLGELSAATELLGRTWDRARDLADPSIGWEAVMAGALFANVYLLDPLAGRGWCERALSQPRLETLKLPRIAVRDHLAYAHAMSGELGAAREEAATLPPDALSHRLVRLLGGDWEDAERAWTTAADHDLAHGDRLNAALNAYWSGQVRWLLGRQGAAIEAMTQALQLALDGPFLPGEVMVRADLARLHAHLGDPAAATEHLDRCDRILATGEDWRGRVGSVELARGAVAAASGRGEVADRACARAVAVFATHRLPWEQARALTTWSRLLAAMRRPEEAAARSDAALALYSHLGAVTRWVED